MLGQVRREWRTSRTAEEHGPSIHMFVWKSTSRRSPRAREIPATASVTGQIHLDISSALSVYLAQCREVFVYCWRESMCENICESALGLGLIE